MLMLRARLEQSLEATLDDATWTLIAKPADVVRIASGLGARGARAAAAGTVSERRSYAINMPQMALGGLSETWLFKELGDMHWGMIMNGLRTASSELKDANGDRLYATFTRFNLESSASLVAYKENEELRIDANISRYGAGTFFSEAQISGDGKSARARLMSSFSKYGEAGSNRSLLKGQPELPADCGIPELPDLPGFGLEYRAVRAARPSTPIFECEYEIIPSHDINGVGLLYFAAYPTINDICAVRHAGRTLMTDFSTCSRDVFYFGNSDPDETLIYRIHRWRGEMDCIAMECSLSRKSDNGLMAYIATVKKRWRSPASATPTSFAMASP
jgi:probable biosynthetic protein (TIGR04098 family)